MAMAASWIASAADHLRPREFPSLGICDDLAVLQSDRPMSSKVKYRRESLRIERFSNAHEILD